MFVRIDKISSNMRTLPTLNTTPSSLCWAFSHRDRCAEFTIRFFSSIRFVFLYLHFSFHLLNEINFVPLCLVAHLQCSMESVWTLGIRVVFLHSCQRPRITFLFTIKSKRSSARVVVIVVVPINYMMLRFPQLKIAFSKFHSSRDQSSAEIQSSRGSSPPAIDYVN